MTDIVFDPIFVCQVGVSCFFGIVFIQSGIDKIVDRAGNLEWLKGHFKATPFAPFVPFLVLTLTLMELGSGVVCALGACFLMAGGSALTSYFGMILCMATFLALMFGQRIAKDYAGAAALVPYFCLSILAVILCSGKLKL